MERYIPVLCFAISVLFSEAQTQVTQKPCSFADASQFDFWTGTWDLTWNDTSRGTNTITRIMDGCALHESFFDPSAAYKGESWTVYNPALKLWQQTWIDNQGGYIVLTGGFEKGQMILSTRPKPLPDGKETVSRMVFYDITAQSFNWKWESTRDNGHTWKTNWLIHYKRKM